VQPILAKEARVIGKFAECVDFEEVEDEVWLTGKL
jgi:hypothetical protein